MHRDRRLKPEVACVFIDKIKPSFFSLIIETMGGVALVVVECINFVLYLICLFMEIFTITSLDDLQSDMIASKDLCDQLNPLFIPMLIIRAVGSVLSLVFTRFITTLTTLPLLGYMIYKFVTKRHRLDFTQIRRNDVLNKEKTKQYIFIATDIVVFLMFFILFIVDLVFLIK
ncbi:putative protein cornichon [Blattamonas nauphoetae]|uniref:Uncharacterized protein n=1 Tax=Blattamonas nauphoetae TaxID=2049346 RepID=A0ABQ9WS99_9EUKA|nr:putative protein cornichon [Blattamonas nauphoetae]